jgi:hypothetical protein
VSCINKATYQQKALFLKPGTRTIPQGSQKLSDPYLVPGDIGKRSGKSEANILAIKVRCFMYYKTPATWWKCNEQNASYQ